MHVTYKQVASEDINTILKRYSVSCEQITNGSIGNRFWFKDEEFEDTKGVQIDCWLLLKTTTYTYIIYFLF